MGLAHLLCLYVWIGLSDWLAGRSDQLCEWFLEVQPEAVSIFFPLIFFIHVFFRWSRFPVFLINFCLSSLQPWSGFQAFIIICFVYMHICFSFGQVSSFCFAKVWKSDVCGYYFCRKNLRVQNFMNLICFSNTHSDIHHFKFQCTRWYG